MSLSTFLKISEVREKFRREFAKPAFALKVPIAAPPLTESYGLTGTAFDYLLRFYVKKLNPFAVTGRWVAEDAVLLLALGERQMYTKAKRMLLKAKEAYRTYLASKNKPRDNLIKAAIGLAHLDPVVRAGFVNPDTFGKLDRRVVTDLKNLIALVNPGDFKARKVCILNPTFGSASQLVGGADADLLIDHRLIEVKTVKHLELDRRTFNQLVGYYVLYRIGGIDGCPSRHRVDTLAVYYARYGVFYSIPIRQVVLEKNVGALIRWFKHEASRHCQRDRRSHWEGKLRQRRGNSNHSYSSTPGV